MDEDPKSQACGDSLLKAAQTPCKILFRDRWLLVVDKPEGVLSHPNPKSKPAGGRPKTAFFGEYDFLEERFSTPAGPVWLAHRLDQDTSGILVAALDARAAQAVKELFERGEVRKQYRALVIGRPASSGVWADHLAVRKTGRFVRSGVIPGRPPNAKLTFRAAASFPALGLTLLDLEPATGKTHQIRIQAASRKFFIAGDEIYGHFAINRKLRHELGLRRMFLHASRLRLKHPVTGSVLSVESPLPDKLADCLRRLGAG